MLRYVGISTALFIVLCCLLYDPVYATVVVSGPANGTCIEKTPGNFTVLNNITIIEGAKNDFPTQNNKTIILTCPAGFEFNPGIGSVAMGTPLPSVNMTAASIAVTSTDITLTISVSGTNKWDSIAIIGIQVRALAYNASGHILRLAGAAGGNASVVGDAGGAGISHGFLQAEGVRSNSTIADGNWSNPAIWSSGYAPNCGDTVYIHHTVHVDAPSRAVFLFIETTGHLISDNPVTVDDIFVMNGNGIYTHNNLGDASTTIFKGVETFAPASTIILNRWYSTLVPLGMYVTGNFGNVTFIVGNDWSQDGYFAPDRIKGTLTVSSGTITMDDGTGLTTALTLQDVVVNNTGALLMNGGAARNFTLSTKNYTDTSTSARASAMLYQSQGNLTWVADGDVYISHDWNAYTHTALNPGNTDITINGDLTIAGGAFIINNYVNAPVILNVSGNTTITGSPSQVRFIDSGNSNLQFNTTNLYVNGGPLIELLGNNSPTGNATVNISNDFILTGAATNMKVINNTTSTANTVLTVGRDFLITDGTFGMAATNGTYTLSAGRNMTVNGSTGKFMGQTYPSCTKLSAISVTGYLAVNTGYFQASQGHGNITLNIVEDVNINNGSLYGIRHLTSANNGQAILNCANINFNGGIFTLVHAVISDGKTISVNCNTDINITFLNATDIFAFISRAGANNALLNLTIGGNLIIGGNSAGAYFMSSSTSGRELVSIGGNMNVSGGDVYFVGNAGTYANSHNIKTTITGDVSVTGGHIRFSAGAGTDTISVGGNFSISGGTVSQKHTTGASEMTIAGEYIQSGGTYIIHSDTTTTSNSCTMTVNGNFSLTNGTFNFENYAAASLLAEHRLYLGGANFTIGGNAIITHANNFTTNFIFGQIYFIRAGTTVYNRTSSTNEIRHVKYTINAGTTVDASASANGFQMTSIGNNVAANHNALTVNGILDMGPMVLSARQAGPYYSRVTVNSGGRYRLSHPGGLYSGVSAVPSSIYGYVTTFNRVNYTLDPNSIVEYYGTATGIITGIPNGAANTNAQKYGILEINFTGAPGTTWLYPETDGEVSIRTSLILTSGELNLDDDHVTTGGGRSINLESGASMSRTNGYIRSETEDGSGLVRWNITTNGARVFHFGYDASTYIPFTFQQTSGNAGIVSLATYRTAPDNNPLPPTVTHVRDVNGNDNSSNTVDRFWHITTGGAVNANLTFSFAAIEGSGILSPRAQQWEPVTMGWFPPAGVQSNPTGTTTMATSLSSFNTWWTLSAGSSPLPVELLSFDVEKSGKIAEISWATATEINNDYFTLERSVDGNNFEVLEIINGAGTSSSAKYYSTKDLHPPKGRSYYRLKQTDFDGHYTYSDVKSIYFNDDGVFSVYPNPVIAGTGITITVPGNGSYHVALFDIRGRQILNVEEDLTTGNKIILNSELQHEPGMYLINITSGENQYSEKIFVK